MEVLDDVAPIKEIRLKQKTEPWMTSTILDLIRQRDKAYYSFRKSGSADEYKVFAKLRNKIQRELKTSKANYFTDKIEEDKNNPKNYGNT